MVNGLQPWDSESQNKCPEAINMNFFIMNEIEGQMTNVNMDFVRSFPGPCTITRQAKNQSPAGATARLHEILQSLPLLPDDNGWWFHSTAYNVLCQILTRCHAFIDNSNLSSGVRQNKIPLPYRKCRNIQPTPCHSDEESRSLGTTRKNLLVTGTLG